MGALVSCLTVSKPDRWGLLQRAIIDFLRQTYTDRELIVAVADARYAEQVTEFVAARPGARVRVIQRDNRDQSSLLTQAQAAARGDYLAVWDDDNLNAPSRLEEQLAGTPPNAASVLGSALYLFYETRELFVSGFEQPNVAPDQRSAVTTLLIPRDLMPAWPALGKGQSSPAVLANALAKRGVRLAVLQKSPGLHLVGVRGDNVRGYEYHRKLATGLPLTKTADWLRANQDWVTKVTEQYLWDRGTVSVSGPDGEAFQLDPAKRWSEVGELFPIGEPKDGVHRSTEKV